MIKKIYTASDILAYYGLCEDGEVIDTPLYECPICGGEYNLDNFEINRYSEDSKLINIHAYEITCPNKKCKSSFILSCVSSIEVDEEEGVIVGRKTISDSMAFINTHAIGKFIPDYLQREFKLAYKELPLSTESSGVYVRKMLELFINNRWPLLKSVKTKGNARSLNLAEKIKYAFSNNLIDQQDYKILISIKNIFNSSAHAETNAKDMSKKQVVDGLTILMKIIRKYSEPPKVTPEEQANLLQMDKQFGISHK